MIALARRQPPSVRARPKKLSVQIIGSQARDVVNAEVLGAAALPCVFAAEKPILEVIFTCKLGIPCKDLA